jgi:hypothetical protein
MEDKKVLMLPTPFAPSRNKRDSRHTTKTIARPRHTTNNNTFGNVRHFTAVLHVCCGVLDVLRLAVFDVLYFPP